MEKEGGEWEQTCVCCLDGSSKAWIRVLGVAGHIFPKQLRVNTRPICSGQVNPVASQLCELSDLHCNLSTTIVKNSDCGYLQLLS